MTKAAFEVGDIVVLKSGGPDMTVASVGPEAVVCVWFDGKRQRDGLFAFALLRVGGPPEKVTIAFQKPGEG
jgi:uncharacterized protein YodC (DUF2158 family)